MSEGKSNVFTALAAAQAEMEGAKKSASNPHYKTKYADLDAVCEAALPALNRHGIAVIQPLERNGDGWVQITRFEHGDSGTSVETPIPLIVGKNDMQGLGSAMTYARRYGLMALAGIAPEDDDGNAASASAHNAPPPPELTPEQKRDKVLASIAKAADADALAALWANERMIAGVASLPEPMQLELQRAHADRKGELHKPGEGAPTDDEIPY